MLVTWVVDAQSDYKISFYFFTASDIPVHDSEPQTPETTTTLMTTSSDSSTPVTDGFSGDERWPELNFENTYNTIFTSFVIASASALLVIVVLLLFVCQLGKGLCQERHECLYKIFCCCCSEKKKKDKRGEKCLCIASYSYIPCDSHVNNVHNLLLASYMLHLDLYYIIANWMSS